MQRDYDKEPIVITDYNPLFISFCLSLYSVFIMVSYLFFDYSYNNNRGLHITAFMFGIGYPAIRFFKGKLKNMSKIRLLNDKIERDGVILSDDLKIYRTFIEYYAKEQNADGSTGAFWKLFIKVFVIFVIFPALFTTKFFFHLFKNGLREYKFYDAVIVFDNKDDFINILPTNRTEYKEVRAYFLEKHGVDIKTAKVFWKIDYGMIPNLEKDKE